MEFALILTVAVASLACGAILGRKFPHSAAGIATAGFVLIAMSVLPRLLPDLFYFLIPPYFAIEVLLACAFVTCGALAAKYFDSVFRGLLQGVLLLLMAYFIVVPHAYLAFQGDHIRDLNREVRDGVTLQSSPVGCVPSSLATVLRTYGFEHTEGEIAYALHTTFLGTDYSRIPRVVREFGRKHGLQARFIRTSLDELRRLNVPAILFVRIGSIRHATALLGFDGNYVVLGEPLEGRIRIPVAQFQDRTLWTGLAALIAPRVEAK